MKRRRMNRRSSRKTWNRGKKVKKVNYRRPGRGGRDRI